MLLVFATDCGSTTVGLVEDGGPVIVHGTVANITPRCNSCTSTDVREFRGEFAVHFAGIEGLSKALVWVFPDVSLCLACGIAHFHVPDRELRVLQTGIPVDGAAVLMENDEEPYGGSPVRQDEAAGSRPSEI